MADTYETKKINELSEATSAENSDLMMVGNPTSGHTSKITKENLMKDINTSITEINSALADLPKIQHGYYDTNITVASGSNVDIEINFDEPFDGVPDIILSFANNTSMNACGSCSICAVASHSTDFTARIYNNSSSSIDQRFKWIAIY